MEARSSDESKSSDKSRSSDTTAGRAGRRVFVDKQSPKAYHSLVETSEAVRAVAADAGLDRTLVELPTRPPAGLSPTTRYRR